MPPPEGGRQDSDLVLPPNTYAYVLDSTKGRVNVCVGPFKYSLSNTDKLVIWRNGRFVEVNDTDQAIMTFTNVLEGQYVVVHAPPQAGAEKHPPIGNSNDAIALDAGKRIIIAGPATFALWPGQSAEVIPGHHLRHNQYVVVQVYEPEEAKAHWGTAVMAPQVATPVVTSEGTQQEPEEPESQGEASTSPPAPEAQQPPEQPPEHPTAVGGDSGEPPDFTMGQLLVIKGTDVSFYIPSTGVEVVPEQGTKYVRDAVTLERLEYCILLDENGEKRYVQGPRVVFPEPTETFLTDPGSQPGRGDNRKFKAIELNDQSGLYIKVIADYTEDGIHHPLGEELFISGKEKAIYFPRPEHSIIQYGTQTKHHAVAVPAGEGRYVLDRNSGKVNLTKGPKMFLPDPRHQVVVRRVLDQKTVSVLYPGNTEAAQVNLDYEAEQQRLEQGEMLRATKASIAMAAPQHTTYMGDVTTRGTSYTPPRTIVLDTKYEGAVSINVWPGYAVLVTDKTGNRRVEVGPANLLLEYDETLMVLELSTGRPKTDHKLLRTAYLRTINNAVGDQIVVETKDIVTVTLDLSYRVNFVGEGDERLKWFDIENYVALLTDHCRSRLRNAAKQHDIQKFYSEAINIIRDTLLGVSKDGERPGLPFKENGMRLSDVEVLNVEIKDTNVAGMLMDAKSTAVRSAIQLSEAETEAARDARLQELKREGIDEEEKTLERESEAENARLIRDLKAMLHEVENESKVTDAKKVVAEVVRGEVRAEQDLSVEVRRKINEVELARSEEEAKQFVSRITAIDGNLADAIQAFGDKSFVQELTTALGPAALAAGVTAADLFQQLFAGTPFEGVFDALADRPFANDGSGNGATQQITHDATT